MTIVEERIDYLLGGFSFTHEKQDAKVGPVTINHKSTETVPISPVLSTIALVGGIGLVVVGSRGV